jgi:hypothetical protein
MEQQKKHAKLLAYFLNNPEFDRTIFRLISFEIIEALIVFAKTSS